MPSRITSSRLEQHGPTAASVGGAGAPAAAPPAVAEGDARPGRRAVLAVATSRLLALAVGFAASYWLGSRFHPGLPRSTDILLEHDPERFVLHAWVHYDAFWFIRIAESGYSAVDRAAFFPLYPLLLRVGRDVGLRYDVAGVVISLACFVGAMVLLYRLVSWDFDRRTALWSVTLLSFASTSFYFQAVYSESLFLLLTVAAFAAGRRGRWLLAGVAGLLAAATRSAGVLLLVPLGWMWLEQRRGRRFELPGNRGGFPPPARRPRAVSLASLLLIPVGIGLFMAYTLVRYGNALLFMLAERHWNRHLHAPTVALVNGARAAITSVQTVAAHPSVFFGLTHLPWEDQWLTLGNLTAFLGLLFGVVLLVVCWRVLPAAYTLFAAVSLLLPLSYPTRQTPLLSMPRFVLVDFPVFVALAVALRGRPLARWSVLAVMVVGLVLLTSLFVNGIWVA